MILSGAAIHLAGKWRREAVPNVGFAMMLGGFIGVEAIRRTSLAVEATLVEEAETSLSADSGGSPP